MDHNKRAAYRAPEPETSRATHLSVSCMTRITNDDELGEIVCSEVGKCEGHEFGVVVGDYLEV